MIWPPIRYSYDTHQQRTCRWPPGAADLDADRGRALRKRDRGRQSTLRLHDLEWNWLGTDDQGRDVVARLIYGFRISVLFGLMLTLFSSVIGVAAGAVQGYFGGWTDLLFQRFIEIWTSVPQLYLLIIIAAVIDAELLDPARHPAPVLLGGAGRRGARRVPARAQFRICQRGARARPSNRQDHLPAPAAQRHGGDADLHALHPQRLDHAR